MHSERDAFLRTIREHPDEDVTRLVYADWLQDTAPRSEPCGRCNGSGRVMVYQYRDGPRCPTCRGKGEINIEQRNCARAEFIRVQCKLAKLGAGRVTGHADCDRTGCKECRRRSLRRRQQELLGKIQNPRPVRDYVIELEYRCGFIESLELPWEQWLRHHAAITGNPADLEDDGHPDVVLREVRLTTAPLVGWRQFPDLRQRMTLYQARVEIGGRIGSIDRDFTVSDSVRDLYRGQMVRERISDVESELINQIADVLGDAFPGHCPNHPLKFVLPGVEETASRAFVEGTEGATAPT